VFTARTLGEGKWSILVLAALSGATIIWCPVAWAPVLPLALLGFTISFFRDPKRDVPADPKALVSPADGKVVEVKTADEPHFLGSEAMMVAIFLSVFDVHVQRAPIEGEIKLVKHNPGRFLDARNPECALVNENRVVGIETADGFRVTVRQVAGLIARRIVGWADEGAKLAKGERIGMIRFGSRVELFVPPGTEVVAKVGDYAKGGETVLARRR
jgi:phosphatidylserine decarboxylase